MSKKSKPSHKWHQERIGAITFHACEKCGRFTVKAEFYKQWKYTFVTEDGVLVPGSGIDEFCNKADE